MGDEEPSEDENPVDSSGDGPKTETKQDDSAPFADKVKNLSSKSIKQIGKWNNESFLYAFDKQLISFGIRLLLFLPGFAVLAYFGAWAYSNSSPSWWIDFIEPTVGQSFFQHLGCVSIRYSSGIHIISCPSSSSS
ncbi:MAG: hypothetical protein CM15mP3_04870 [Candidatus Poseidoniales archaeon]|nr:MAG: hypothetical protein CM15mP3_04870 [Candidatus Poseidoniales archaeon]